MVKTQLNYKWYILTLVVVTYMIVIAIPAMGMSVMAKEISQDLGLNLVQVGVVWGVGSLPAIFTFLLGGAIGDKFGGKKVLILCSITIGLLGAARGLTTNFISLVFIMILIGVFTPFVSMGGMKMIVNWFPTQQLGLANGFVSMGMALGFLIGSFFSATTFSPLLGGWRNVLILYGLTGVLISCLWFFMRAAPSHQPTATQRLDIKTTITHVARLRDIWLLGFMGFGVCGCIQGILGFLPLYLRSLGWVDIHADGALSVFHTISMICVLPISIWSDRMGSPRRLLFFTILMIAAGAGLLSFAHGIMVWLAVIMAGFVRDAFMALYTTIVIKTDGVGPLFAGTAVGFAWAINSAGSVIAPPIGNSLNVLWSGAPFAFWSGMALLGMLCLSLVKSQKYRKSTIELGEAQTTT